MEPMELLKITRLNFYQYLVVELLAVGLSINSSSGEVIPNFSFKLLQEKLIDEFRIVFNLRFNLMINVCPNACISGNCGL